MEVVKPQSNYIKPFISNENFRNKVLSNLYYSGETIKFDRINNVNYFDDILNVYGLDKNSRTAEYIPKDIVEVLLASFESSKSSKNLLPN
jgi:hypothetical protein